MTKIIAIATEAGKYKLDLNQMHSFVQRMNQDAVAKRKFGFLVQDTSIAYKHAVLPDFKVDCSTPLLYKTPENPPSTAERMAIYEQEAPKIGLSVANAALKKAGLAAEQITHIVTVSCTGMFAPGLEAVLCEQLGLRITTERHTVNFMGCYAAFHGLRLADLICRATPNSTVLVVCVELCSLHFRQDSSDDNLLSTYLFSDGAAACIVTNEAVKTQSYLLAKQFNSVIIPEGKEDMAWRVGNTGFEMILRRTIPKHIEQNIAAVFAQQTTKLGINPAEIQHFAIHPGGKNILKAFENALNLSPLLLQNSYDILKEYGNMSSATILFVLENLLENMTENEHRATIYAAAFGPGLTVETAFFSYQTAQNSTE